MKKTIIIFAGILVGLFVLLTILDWKGEYRAEKAIWKINRDFGKISKDPNTIPEAEFQRVYKGYIKFKNQYPHSKLAPIAHMLAARVHVLRKDFVKARGIYEEVIKANKNNPNICAQAVLEIGQSYTQENNFPAMIDSLRRIINNYPLTDLGYQAPLILAESYLKRGDLENGQKALNDAVDHFNGLMIKNKSPDVAFNSLRSLSICYVAMKKWQKAVDVLGEILIKFPDTHYISAQRADKIITSINMISITKLKNYDLPVSIYQDFIAKNPNHPYRKALEAIIKSINLLKEKNVNVLTK